MFRSIVWLCCTITYNSNTILFNRKWRARGETTNIIYAFSQQKLILVKWRRNIYHYKYQSPNRFNPPRIVTTYCHTIHLNVNFPPVAFFLKVSQKNYVYISCFPPNELWALLHRPGRFWGSFSLLSIGYLELTPGFKAAGA
jgi:hypothetical protein